MTSEFLSQPETTTPSDDVITTSGHVSGAPSITDSAAAVTSQVSMETVSGLTMTSHEPPSPSPSSTAESAMSTTTAPNQRKPIQIISHNPLVFMGAHEG